MWRFILLLDANSGIYRGHDHRWLRTLNDVSFVGQIVLDIIMHGFGGDDGYIAVELHSIAVRVDGFVGTHLSNYEMIMIIVGNLFAGGDILYASEGSYLFVCMFPDERSPNTHDICHHIVVYLSAR